MKEKGGLDGGASTTNIAIQNYKRLLLENAREWYELGIPVVPVRIYSDENGKWEKKPIVNWSRWEEKTQTEEEFENLPWDRANGYAIICGSQLKSGFYIFAIDLDFDAGEAYEKLQASGIYIDTRVEKTVSNRLHLIYLSRTPVRTLSKRNKDDDIPTELLGQGRLCVMAPSYGYVAVVDVLPAVVEDGITYFLDLIEALGYDARRLLSVEDREKRENGEPYLQALLERIKASGKIEIKNETRKWLYVHCPFHPPDDNPSFAINLEKYYAIDFHNNEAYSLKRLAEKLGVELRLESGNTGVTERKTAKRYLVGRELLAKRYLVEIVEVGDVAKILVFDVEANEINVYDEFELEGVTYQPYPNLPFEYLPTIPEKINDDTALWNDTYQFIWSYYDNPRNENVYHVLTAGVAWSYFCLDVKVSTPYIGFLGPYRTGKGRGLEAMTALCYKAIHLIDPSEASTFRIIEELKPTLIIDEAQVLDKTIQAILDAGYRYGAKLPRVIDAEKQGLDGVRWYDVFGFKIYASREEPPPNTYSRTIPIKCEKNVRPTLKILPKDKALQLRTRWLAQRLRLYNKVTITFEEFKSNDGRLQELFSPLLVMARIFGGSEAIKAVEQYGREVEEEILDMESTSDDAIILEALAEIINSASNDSPEYITVKEITKKLNDGYDRPVYDPRYVGRRLGILGFRRKRLHGGERAYLIDYSLLERLANRYNITDIVTKNASGKNLYMGCR